MTKSADAFRTISEVADWLGVQPHVLRFWESKFTQVKPVKRAGGRRYYRPNDMLLLGGIRKLLHEDGLTIKGVQKLMREEGMAYVADMSPALDEQLAQVSFDSPPEPTPVPMPVDPAQPDMFAEAPQATPLSAVPEDISEPDTSAPDVPAPDASESEIIAFTSIETPDPAEPLAVAAPEVETSPVAEAPMAEDVIPEPAEVTHLPSFLTAENAGAPMTPPDAAPSDDTVPAAAEEPEGVETTLPHFSRADTGAAEPAAPLETEATQTPSPQPAKALPNIIDAPDPDETALTAAPGALSAAAHLGRITPAQRQIIAPLAARLAAHRDQLASGGASNRPV